MIFRKEEGASQSFRNRRVLLALIQRIAFQILEQKTGKPRFFFTYQPVCQNDAEPGDILSYPEITLGYTLQSLGKGDRESHS